MKCGAGPHKILLVDDASAVREALYWAFENVNDLVVVGEADSGQQAIDQTVRLAPDIVIFRYGFARS